MTLPREPETEPEPITARVRAGPSPWLVAVIALVVLATAIYIGVSGPSTTSPAPSHGSNAIVAVVPPPTPTASPVALDSPQPTATVNVVGQPANPPATYLAARLTVDGHDTLAVLNSQGPKQFHASYSVALPAPVATANLQILDVVNDTPGLASYGDWNVSVGVFHGGGDLNSIIDSFQPTVLVADSRAPDPTADPSASPLDIDGYSIQVTGQSQNSAEVYDINLTLGSGPTFPDETYKLVARAGSRQFVGQIQHVLPGHIAGEVKFPTSLLADNVLFTLKAVSNARGHATTIVATYPVKLPAASGYNHGFTMADFDMPASAGKPSPSGIAAVGYKLHVLGIFDGPGRAIFFDLTINPTYSAAAAQ